MDFVSIKENKKKTSLNKGYIDKKTTKDKK